MLAGDVQVYEALHTTEIDNINPLTNVEDIFVNSIRRAKFTYDNTLIRSTVVQAGHRKCAGKLMCLGSSRIYSWGTHTNFQANGKSLLKRRRR